jgi:hypothetical protein
MKDQDHGGKARGRQAGGQSADHPRDPGLQVMLGWLGARLIHL